MRRQRSRTRQARLRQFYETLPPIQQGIVICAFLGNALLVVTVDAVAAGAIRWLVAHALMRAVDTGRAAGWLERSERWVTPSATGHAPPA
jgi:hypothetical protein